MPIERAKLQAQAKGVNGAVPELRHGSAPGYQPAEEVQAVQGGEHIEEGICRVARQEIAEIVELSPCHELADEKAQREDAGCRQADAGLGWVVLASTGP